MRRSRLCLGPKRPKSRPGFQLVTGISTKPKQGPYALPEHVMPKLGMFMGWDGSNPDVAQPALAKVGT